MYNSRIDKVLTRKTISVILSPFRMSILKRIEKHMMKFTETNYICSMASQYDYRKQLFAKEIYGVPKEYLFEGHYFYGPEYAHEYLSQLFGEDYMQLPPLSKRRKGFDIYLEELR